MTRDYWVMAALAIVSVLFLTILGQPNNHRKSLFLFLVAQVLTWPLTLVTVLLDFGESPVRLFPKATDGNFLFAFVFLPSAFVAYYWHYPRNRNSVFQCVYTLAFTGSTTLVHVAVQKYTNLFLYITLSGYHLWLSVIAMYYIQRIYSDWFFYQLDAQSTRRAK